MRILVDTIKQGRRKISVDSIYIRGKRVSTQVCLWYWVILIGWESYA